MFCNKCGTKNPDTSVYCSKCGEKLNISPDTQAPEQSPKKKKTGLLIGIAAGGVAVIAVTIALVLIFTGDKTGQFEPTDSSMAAAVVSAPPSSSAPPPPVTPTEAASASAPEITQTPTENPPVATPTPHHTSHPTSHPTPTPSTTLGTPPTPPPSPTPTSSFMIFLPIIIDYSDILGNWGFSALGFEISLTFNGDNTFNMSGISGTYYYDPSTLSGTITSSSGTTHFTLSADKQSLRFEDGATYHRY